MVALAEGSRHRLEPSPRKDILEWGVWTVQCLVLGTAFFAHGAAKSCNNELSGGNSIISNITNRSREVKSRWGHILNISKFIAKDSNVTNASCLVIGSFH